MCAGDCYDLGDYEDKYHNDPHDDGDYEDKYHNDPHDDGDLIIIII